ncbi:MAG: hypothetical protein IJH37_00335 [Clostridia bacterium]|nr:hypothetical protein [Clostridia bacterium]
MEEKKDVNGIDEAALKINENSEEIYDSSYGLSRRSKAMLKYALTAFLCAAIIVSAYGIAVILPVNSEITEEYAEALRKGDAYTSLKKEYSRLSAEVKALDETVSEQEAQIKELDDPEEKKAELRNEIEKKQNELKKINEDVSDKTEKLAEINSKIASASGAILSLSPGRYAVGRDIAPGRYTITGYGGFAAANSAGQSKYNTTLGNAAYEVELSSGDKLKLDCTVKFTPVS